MSTFCTTTVCPETATLKAVMEVHWQEVPA
jgi:hypothetical protein